MPSEESIKILQRAIALWKKAGDNPSEREYRDFISLIQLAIQKAGEPLSIAHSMLAQVHFDVDNFPAAWEEADRTLALDPDDFKCQSIKTLISFAVYWQIEEDSQEKRKGFWGAVGDLVGATKQGVRGTFAAGRAGKRIGEALTSGLGPAPAKKKAFEELGKLINVFNRNCSNGITAYHFVDYSRKLIKLADGLLESGLRLDRSMNLYAIVASVPLGNITCESNEEREQVETVRLVAEGRMSL